MLGISDATESIGMRTQGVKITFKQLTNDVSLPCILHWNQNHFVVCYGIRRLKRGLRIKFTMTGSNDGYVIKISDPAGQKYEMNQKEFCKCWFSSKNAGNILYIAWILSFMRFRRKLDFKRFAQASANQSNLVQLVTGMQEIKLNNCEKQQRWKWERIQVKLFKISIQGTALGQYQQIGSIFFSQTTGLLISYLSAKAVVEGNITLGMMMAISYILGQLSGPMGAIIGSANIVAGDEEIDKKRLLQAVEIANIREFIESLPLKYNSKIGIEGNGISQGQRQRLLIARAVYKNPDFLFFDEATNALDVNNERIIMDNLAGFYKGKTTVIVAHRLSTVQNADKIFVLEKGRAIEEGTHTELTAKRGAYYILVKNQLELGT